MTIRVLLTIGLVLTFPHRLPAPIQEAPESTPTPKPKREVVVRPKPKPEATPKPKATPNRAFAGTWIGSTTDTSSNGDTGSSRFVIKISDDEKTVLINWELNGESASGSDFQTPCNKFGNTLSWALKQMGENPTWVCTDTFQLNGDGTANFIRKGNWIGGDFEGGTYTCTGTFSRQGASSPSLGQSTAALPASPTPTAPPTNNVAAQTTENIPVAKADPNRPGFVFNPFNPTSRFRLDVRGKPSGTKLIEPKSGKLFIVP
jgi:hypothetical protein